MAKHKKYNPERRAWRGTSYRKGRFRIRDLRERDVVKVEKKEKGDVQE